MPGKKKKTVSQPAPDTLNKGTLYVVATPIGNLEDITLRAVRILKEVDLIAAEDTRHTRKLLTHFGISTRTMSYYKEKERERAAVIIGKLQEGLDVALVSDAGTPGISDPGSILVHDAAAHGIKVEPVPGPSSLTAAVSVAGIRENTFIFLGFAPSRKKQRQDILQSMRQEKKHLVFFEAPHRLQSFLQDCLAILGDREIFWCRELTKLHEEQTKGTISDILARWNNDKKIRGESVLIVSGFEGAPEISDKEIRALLMAYKKKENVSLKDAVQMVTKAHSLSRSAVYQMALKIWL
jgi:16S rRNA (cytidine1402-2'-O)-methyltransferase